MTNTWDNNWVVLFPSFYANFLIYVMRWSITYPVKIIYVEALCKQILFCSNICMFTKYLHIISHFILTMILFNGVMKVIKDTNSYKAKKLYGLSDNRSRIETRGQMQKNQLNTTAVNEVKSNRNVKRDLRYIRFQIRLEKALMEWMRFWRW